MGRKIDDLTGQRFGRLVATKYIGNAKWECICDCGNTVVVLAANLKRGNSKSCGCNKKPPMIGKRFGKLIVFGEAEKLIKPSGKTVSRWNVRCDCGTVFIASGFNLRNGTVRQCKICKGKQQSKSIKKHGGKNTRIYGVWRGMIDRCYRKNHIHFNRYGGRGIIVCAEWLGEHGFENFRDWAYANGYDKTAPHGMCTIDRINNDGNYEPSNCRWATVVEQNRNRGERQVSKRSHIEIDGEIKTLKQWCEIYNISYSCVYNRIFKYNWDTKTAFLTPSVQKAF